MAGAQDNYRGGMEPRRRFRILKELAEGAFGKVYLAEMITGDNFKSVVAIKLLHGKWVGHEEIVQRSRDEARVLGLLHHRNIVRVEDLTSINGQCAIIMEYLEGVDLKSLIRFCLDNQVRVPRKVAFEIVASAATALDAAFHRKTLNSGQPLELIHRDIKPSNVMVTVAGEVKVLDFGTARAQFEHREAETQALAFGSAAYMAPERMMGDPDGPAGDVFSLGITLYELLAMKGFGKIFIRGEKFDESLNERVDALELSELGQARSTQVRQVLRLMLAYDPEERPSAQQVVELMEALADEIQDGSIRRFCREIVKPAHETLDYTSNPNDPFTGSTLFEDSSRVRKEAIEDVEKRVTVDIDPVETGAEYISDVVDPEDPVQDNDGVEPLDITQGEFEHTDVAADGYSAELLSDDAMLVPDEEGSSIEGGSPDAPSATTEGRGFLGLAVIGLLLGVGVLFGMYTLLVPEATPPVEIGSEAPKYMPGGRIETGQAGGKGGDMVINLVGLGSANVAISGGMSSFTFRWDGTGTLELVDLDPGSYRLRVRTTNTTEVLEARVESGRTCAYRYDLESEGDEWDESGC